VHAILAEGGAALFAGVKSPSYVVNSNGSVTFDLIQVSASIIDVRFSWMTEWPDICTSD
jgi:hypothetical protein